jgi:hypothetical protein
VSEFRPFTEAVYESHGGGVTNGEEKHWGGEGTCVVHSRGSCDSAQRANERGSNTGYGNREAREAQRGINKLVRLIGRSSAVVHGEVALDQLRRRGGCMTGCDIVLRPSAEVGELGVGEAAAGCALRG